MPEFRPALSHSTANHLADTNAALAIEQLLVNLARHSLAKVVAQGSHLGAIAGRPLGITPVGATGPERNRPQPVSDDCARFLWPTAMGLRGRRVGQVLRQFRDITTVPEGNPIR